MYLKLLKNWNFLLWPLSLLYIFCVVKNISLSIFLIEGEQLHKKDEDDGGEDREKRREVRK